MGLPKRNMKHWEPWVMSLKCDTGFKRSAESPCRYVQHNAALQSEWERMCSATSSLIINVSENGISMLAKNTKVALSFIGRSKKILKKVTRNRIDVRKM